MIYGKLSRFVTEIIEDRMIYLQFDPDTTPLLKYELNYRTVPGIDVK